MCEEPLQAGNGPCDVCGLWHLEGIVAPQDVVLGRSSPAAADAEVPGFNLEVATSVEVRHLNSEVATSVEVQASEPSIGGAMPSPQPNAVSGPAVFPLSRSPSGESLPPQGDALDSWYDSNSEWENCRYLVPEMLSALQPTSNEPEITQFVLESCSFPMHCDLRAASLSISRQRLALLSLLAVEPGSEGEPCAALIEECQQQVEDLEAQASVLLRFEQKHRVKFAVLPARISSSNWMSGFVLCLQGTWEKMERPLSKPRRRSFSKTWPSGHLPRTRNMIRLSSQPKPSRRSPTRSSRSWCRPRAAT